MAPRVQLQSLLEELLGSRAVYFQQPSAERMVYPCIVYALDDVDSTYADNTPYNHHNRYKVTVIDGDPDSLIPRKVANLPMSSFDRRFPANDLNHDVFNLYF